MPPSLPSCLAPIRPAAKRGALLYPNSCYYQGDLDSSFVPHGSGCMYRADGSEMMSGQWTRGRLQGIGRRIESGGDRYEGEFVDSKAQGLGRYSWPDGRTLSPAPVSKSPPRHDSRSVPSSSTRLIHWRVKTTL